MLNHRIKKTPTLFRWDAIHRVKNRARNGLKHFSLIFHLYAFAFECFNFIYNVLDYISKVLNYKIHLYCIGLERLALAVRYGEGHHVVYIDWIGRC